MNGLKIRNAIVSVSNKEGIDFFCKELEGLGVKIFSTGGTFKKLINAGINAKKIEDLTGFPEILNGRVKTLHPRVHAGILAKNSENHLQELRFHGIEKIDLVVVNFYPFERALKNNLELSDLIEEIDIGGPSMVRAAAKNFENTAVIVDNNDFEGFLKELKEKGEISLSFRKELAVKAFELTSFYDSIISNSLRKKFFENFFSELKTIPLKKIFECRYGENPHQKGFLYLDPLTKGISLANAKILQGKQMSFNNFLDLNSALELLLEFEMPTTVIVKHNNPCGVACYEKIEIAFEKALKCDKRSAFGGIIVLNRECNELIAEKIVSFFNEIVLAPSFSEKALKVFSKKKNLRVIELKELSEKKINGFDVKKVLGGFLLQEKDLIDLNEKELNFVSKRKPSKKELQDLIFAWKIVKHVKSNAIVIVKDLSTIGIGAGQMSRIESVELALKKACEKPVNAVLASDAFFPFKDSIELAAKNGITAIIEPGGSIKDMEVIESANKNNIALVFTGIRHFKH
jgi:phosphoribosylaminoimidazolecarboxamide formyltransferase/IMP cyclohydrolase